jgi:hypothetical protein
MHLFDSKQVIHLVAFDVEVMPVVFIGFYQNRNPAHDFNTVITQCIKLPWIVCYEIDATDPELIEYLAGDLVGAHVARKAQLYVGLYCIQSGVLQGIGLDFVEKADSTALLAKIYDHSCTPGLDVVQSPVELLVAVTPPGFKYLTGQAFGVYPHIQDVRIFDCSLVDDDMFRTAGFLDDPNPELTMAGWQFGNLGECNTAIRDLALALDRSDCCYGIRFLPDRGIRILN